MIAGRPLPEITPLSTPFWSAAKDRLLVLQQCDECGDVRFPPEVACPACGSQRHKWAAMSGKAALFSWTVAHPPLLPFFAERAPWPVAVVQLEEGPRMVTNVIGVPPEQFRIGMAMEAAFEDVAEDVTLVVFRPAA